MRWKPRTANRALQVTLAVAVAVLAGCGHGPDQPAVEPEPSDDEPRWIDDLRPAVDLSAFTTYPCDSPEAVAAGMAISALTGDMIDVTDPAFLEGVRGEEGVDQLLVSGPYLAGNELHDCQRLVVPRGAGLDLGPLTALYVDRAALEGLDPGSQAGVVGEIINYDDQPYASLGIQPGLNCLWVEPASSADGEGWWAAVRQPREGETCVTTEFDGTPAVPLEVRRLTHGGSFYPSTGRWMWDGAASVRSQYIGIRCGIGWCELGPSGFNPTSAIADSSQVPGWFDDQYISYMGPGSSLRLSQIWARLEPEEAIWWTDDPARFETPQGLHVATIRFQGGSATGQGRMAYHNKLGLPPGLDRHEIRIRTELGTGGEYVWYAKSPGSGWTHIRRLPYTHGVTGSVRWLWLYDDEGGWLPCDRGCCPVDQLRRVGS